MKYIFTFLLCCISLNVLTAQVTANAGSDPEVCHADTLKVVGGGLGANDTGTYVWKNINTNTVVSNSSLLKLRVFSTNNGYKFELKVTKNAYNGTFVSYDTITLQVNPLPTFDYKGLPPLCYSDCPKLLSFNVAIGIAGYDPSIRDSTLKFYQKKSPSWVSGAGTANSPSYYNFCNYLTNAQIPSSGARDTICYEYTDPKGCYANSCKSIKFNSDPIVELRDQVVCQANGDAKLDNMVVKPFNKTGGIQSFRCIVAPSNLPISKDSLVRTVSNLPVEHYLKIDKSDTNYTGKYVMEYCFVNATTACMTCDTANLVVIKKSHVKIKQLAKRCVNSPAFDLDTFILIDGKQSSSGTYWKCFSFGGSRDTTNSTVKAAINGAITNNKFTGSMSGQYGLKCYYIGSGCESFDSAIIIVNGLPIVQIELQDTLCSNAGNVELFNITPAGKVGKWSGPGVSGTTFNPNVSNKQKYIEGPFTIKYEYTNPLTGCTSSDSESILVQTKPAYTKGVMVAKRNGTYIVKAGLGNFNFVDTNSSKGKWNFDNGKSSNYFVSGWVSYVDSGWHKAYITSKVANCDIYDSVEFKFDYKTLGVHNVQYKYAVYPNPTSTNLNVIFEHDAQLQIIDLNGKIVRTTNLKSGELETIDINDLSAGQYFIQIIGNGISIKERFTKL